MSAKAQSLLPQSSPRASRRQGGTRGDSRTVVKKMTLIYNMLVLRVEAGLVDGDMNKAVPHCRFGDPAMK